MRTHSRLEHVLSGDLRFSGSSSRAAVGIWVERPLCEDTFYTRTFYLKRSLYADTFYTITFYTVCALCTFSRAALGA